MYGYFPVCEVRLPDVILKCLQQNIMVLSFQHNATKHLLSISIKDFHFPDSGLSVMNGLHFYF